MLGNMSVIAVEGSLALFDGVCLEYGEEHGRTTSSESGARLSSVEEYLDQYRAFGVWISSVCCVFRRNTCAQR